MRSDLLSLEAVRQRNDGRVATGASTSVATAEGRVPLTRSPSPWPGTLRFSTSAGRAAMDTMPRMTTRPVGRRAIFGRRIGLPDRSGWVRLRSICGMRRTPPLWYRKRRACCIGAPSARPIKLNDCPSRQRLQISSC
ncbi:hypothetical protein AQF52_6802 [Streptomyces venezuelae]|nr:hypothetical protein AQF52_6802 [Streptomyces venezuelae]